LALQLDVWLKKVARRYFRKRHWAHSGAELKAALSFMHKGRYVDGMETARLAMKLIETVEVLRGGADK
jgi:hypothetical protein